MQSKLKQTIHEKTNHFFDKPIAIVVSTSAYSQSSGKSSKEEKKETKLTIDERVQVMTKELQLTTAEQAQIKGVLTQTQQEKDKIKALNLKKKVEKEKVEKIKDIQKAKFKKILGSKRYEKYRQLKKDDVL